MNFNFTIIEWHPIECLQRIAKQRNKPISIEKEIFLMLNEFVSFEFISIKMGIKHLKKV